MEFGVIGCGRISQIMHLPYLQELPEAEIGAIADPVSSVREEIADRYNVDRRYGKSLDLIDSEADRVDAVLIASPPHTHPELAEAALRTNIHTLVEKPLALNLEEADRMVAAAEASDATAMVGYMKRHDPTYQRMQSVVDEREEINRIVGTLVLGQHDELLDEVYDLVEGDLPSDIQEAGTRQRTESIAQAIGTEDPEIQRSYASHLSASCHDLNALRGLFGKIERVKFVDINNDYSVLLAILEFTGGKTCVFTSSFNTRKEWEEFIRVETPADTLVLEMTNPYLKNDPFTITRVSGQEHLERSSHSVSYEESFKCELEHFIECASSGRAPQTPFEEGRNDVARFIDFFRNHLADAA